VTKVPSPPGGERAKPRAQFPGERFFSARRSVVVACAHAFVRVLTPARRRLCHDPDRRRAARGAPRARIALRAVQRLREQLGGARDKEALARLTKKIREGGVGVWGQIPMPANPQVTEAEAQTLAKWVLSLK
jgi:hypothetical protein